MDKFLGLNRYLEPLMSTAQPDELKPHPPKLFTHITYHLQISSPTEPIIYQTHHSQNKSHCTEHISPTEYITHLSTGSQPCSLNDILVSKTYIRRHLPTIMSPAPLTYWKNCLLNNVFLVMLQPSQSTNLAFIRYIAHLDIAFIFLLCPLTWKARQEKTHRGPAVRQISQAPVFKQTHTAGDSRVQSSTEWPSVPTVFVPT